MFFGTDEEEEIIAYRNEIAKKQLKFMYSTNSLQLPKKLNSIDENNCYGKMTKKSENYNSFKKQIRRVTFSFKYINKNVYGMTLTSESPVCIASVINNSNADISGLMVGDCLLKINEKSIVKLKHEKVIRLLGKLSEKSEPEIIFHVINGRLPPVPTNVIQKLICDTKHGSNLIQPAGPNHELFAWLINDDENILEDDNNNVEENEERRKKIYSVNSQEFHLLKKSIIDETMECCVGCPEKIQNHNYIFIQRCAYLDSIREHSVDKLKNLLEQEKLSFQRNPYLMELLVLLEISRKKIVIRKCSSSDKDMVSQDIDRIALFDSSDIIDCGILKFSPQFQRKKKYSNIHILCLISSGAESAKRIHYKEPNEKYEDLIDSISIHFFRILPAKNESIDKTINVLLSYIHLLTRNHRLGQCHSLEEEEDKLSIYSGKSNSLFTQFLDQLTDDFFFNNFFAFLKREYSEENLEFFLDVNSLEDSVRKQIEMLKEFNVDSLRHLQNFIGEEFFVKLENLRMKYLMEDDSPKYLNIPQKLFEQFYENYYELKRLFSRLEKIDGRSSEHHLTIQQTFNDIINYFRSLSPESTLCWKNFLIPIKMYIAEIMLKDKYHRFLKEFETINDKSPSNSIRSNRIRKSVSLTSLQLSSNENITSKQTPRNEIDNFSDNDLIFNEEKENQICGASVGNFGSAAAFLYPIPSNNSPNSQTNKDEMKDNDYRRRSLLTIPWIKRKAT
ncbi:hypothetical protein SNEBB_003133 [Seison nebaliae]|nr:hypothetical protein SNEBB_003133 [Seison nebaliae]